MLARSSSATGLEGTLRDRMIALAIVAAVVLTAAPDALDATPSPAGSPADPSPVRAQPPTDADAGTAAPIEVDVVQTDGGFAAALDGGAGDALGIEPPALAEDSPAEFPEALRAKGASGEVELQLLIDESGEVAEASVARGGEPLFEAAALEAARRLVFRPARMGGAPIAARLSFLYRFEPPPPAAPRAPKRGILRGLVRQKGLRTPLAGATVDCGDPAETGPDGRFELALPAGPNPCRVSAPGHRPSTFVEQLKEGESLEVVYGLESVHINPYETVVRGERERTELSRVTLRGQELREVPGTMGDPFRAVMLLPGVSSLASGIAYPVVRGTAPAATGYFLDGVRVPFLYHLGLGPAVVHPDFIDAVDFYPGAPPSEYGRLLGGAIEGRIRRSRDDRWHGTVYADLINAGGLVEYPVAKTGTNFTVAGRVSYTPWLTALVANAAMKTNSNEKSASVVLDFWDYQARVEQELWGGRLRLFAFGSNDKVGTESEDPEVTSGFMSILFHRIDLRYRHHLLGGDLEAGVTHGLDRIGVDWRQVLYDQDTNSPSLDRSVFFVDESIWRGRARWERLLSDRLTLSAGADVERQADALTATAKMGQLADRTFPVAVGTFFGLWSQLAWKSADQRWRVTPGLRLDAFHAVPGITRASADPRIGARLVLDDHWALKAGAGLFHQQPIALIQLPAVDVDGLKAGLQEGVQLTAGVEWKGASGLQVSADVYYNPLLRTLELDLFSPPTKSTPSRLDPAPAVSSGYATGLEVMVRHPLGGNWFGWISYTLQRSVRKMQFDRLDDFGQSTGTVSAVLPYTYDQTHVLNAVLSYKFPSNWTVGGVLHINTGRPEAGNLTSWTQREAIVNRRPAWIEVSRDEVDRLPPFWRVDLRVAKSWSHDLYNLDLYLDVLNASFRTETYSFTYVRSSPLKKVAQGAPIVLPMLGVKGTY
jgi:TonB family protein